MEMPVAEAQLFSAGPMPMSRLTMEEREQAYAWERSRAAYRRFGSYDQLERSLRRMEQAFPHGYALLVRRYLWDVFVEAPEGLEERALEWLANDLPRVRVPHWVVAPEPSIRERVLELRASRLGAGQIAKQLEIPKGAVKRILRSERLAA
jgi:hypothetical protein